MRRGRVTEVQVFAILEEGEAGIATSELIRRQGIGENSIHD